MKNINEFFALPLNLKQTTAFDSNIKLYTSESLKKNYLEAISKSSRINDSLLKDIERLVSEDKIVPCFLTKNIFKFLIFKFLRPEGISNIYGTFDPRTNKVYILINNNVNVFSYTNNDAIAKLTNHECIHMYAAGHKDFINYFESYLNDFYSSFFMSLFNLKDVDEKDINIIIHFLYNNFEINDKIVDNSILYKYYDLLNKKFKKLTTLDNELFLELLRLYILTIKMYLKDLTSFINSIKHFQNILTKIETTYNKFGIDSKYTIFIQELIYPSEVISIFSEEGKFKSKIQKHIYTNL